MNKVILMGRLTRDPEVRYTQTGKVVCQFTLAVDRPFANQEGQREATGSGAPVQSGDAGPKSEMESFGSAVPFDEEIPF